MENDTIDSPPQHDDNVVMRSRSSKLWKVLGKKLPRGEIVFFAQLFLIYAVVGVSLVNLSIGQGPDKLWVALLSSSLGYLLPHPTIDPPGSSV